MFECGGGVVPTEAVTAMVAALARLDTEVGDAERVDQIRALEELKAAAAAAQARVTAAFSASRHAAAREAATPARRAGQGVAAQVGLARRESPARAARYTGWAQILVAELPATLAALTAGRITEWRAMIVARETGWLSREHRTAVDAELAGRLDQLGDRGVEAAARAAGYRLDPGGALARVRGAEADRRVSVRPAPEVMCRLSALLPAAQGIAAWAALHRAAEAARADGDPRGRGQVMADTLVQRLTGQTDPAATPIEIQLVMTDQALLDPGSTLGGDPSGAAASAGRDEPAVLLGYGPVPAEVARRLVLAGDQSTAVWVRRLYRQPGSGQLVGMDSARRCFPAALRRFLVTRDQTCRTLWCDAPIRHLDHAVPHEQGGATSAGNGQGLCEACNYAKQAPGWTTLPADPSHSGTRHAVTTTTPTGHTYTSRAPDPPGAKPGQSTPQGTPAATGTPRPPPPTAGRVAESHCARTRRVRRPRSRGPLDARHRVPADEPAPAGSVPDS